MNKESAGLHGYVLITSHVIQSWNRILAVHTVAPLLGVDDVFNRIVVSEKAELQQHREIILSMFTQSNLTWRDSLQHCALWEVSV